MTEHGNTRALQWFRRAVGAWTAERRYLFAPKMEPNKMTTKFTVEEGMGGNQFVIQWQGNTSGTMEVELNGLVLGRSRDYFGEEAHSSAVEVLDNDCIVLHTEYDGMKVREEIRLLNDDCVRLRQTIGTDNKTGTVRLVGQYTEFRL